VAVVLGPDGLPAEVALAAGGDGHASSYRVAVVGEVWRVDDEWWRARIARRYVELVLEGGKHVMLFEDLTCHEWFVQDI
jgi:hypothetical protein